MQKIAYRQYVVRFGSAMTVYVIAIIVSGGLIKAINAENPARYAIAVIPVVPLLFALAAFIQYLRRMDEMQRRIQVEAFGISLAVTGFTTFTIGLLERVGLPQPSMIWIFPFMIMVWGFAQIFVTRRYR